MLAGVRILEVAQWWFVPSAGAVLADWGAEVIKVESPMGDVTRAFFANPANGQSPIYANENRGKRGVVLDTTRPEGRAALKALLKDAEAKPEAAGKLAGAQPSSVAPAAASAWVALARAIMNLDEFVTRE